MADQSKKQPPYPPHFLQPVLPGFATSCSIPASFYKKYLEGTGCERVELRSFRRRRTGWDVGMVGRRMVGGWREFAEEHHLKDGYFLVFKYDGKLRFDVSVFDKSQFEIEYQQLDEDDVMENEEKDEHEKLKIMDFGHTTRDTEDRAEVPTSAKRRKAEEVPKFHTSACEIETPEIDEDEDADVEEDAGESKMESDCTGRRNNKQYSSSRVSTESFISTVKPSYLTGLYFPTIISEANKLNGSCSITIKDDEGKLWPVKIRLKRENVVYTGAGWQSFVEGNDLQEGDKFKFRIISKGKIPILSFHRIDMERYAGQKAEVPQPASRYAQPGTYFVRTSTQCELDKSKLFVSKKFAKRYDLANKCGKIILRISEGKQWVTTLKHQDIDNCRFFITTGWRAFALANGLLPGCLFGLEIIETETEVLNLKLTKRVT